ncbi:methyltransferase domain-containing protein [Anaerobacillus sp. CMMVII]|uniref:class I SAM-dependent methyltransferase n=1 Tax=Anaerobacillus sp. CMMVII TaxID=2755588 RepID=UPI0021B7D94D|nr:methyltransferase domain-containing protein [Anaerobacillus sp. CMMVII]MCT8138052.1 methyltransferase domain-containing protein [Anaerobacillus sp. CMMVII]
MDPRNKWNSKYKNRLNDFEQKAPNVRLTAQSNYLQGGTALDLACGLGVNSLWLATLGYQVQAVDISDVAINYVKEQAEKEQLFVEAKLCDLSDWHNLNVKENSLDLIVITYYLDRTIFPYLKSSIKEDGYLFMETFYMSPQKDRQTVSDQFKLRSKELLSEFGDWQVLFYEEHEQEGRQTIFVRKS